MEFQLLPSTHPPKFIPAFAKKRGFSYAMDYYRRYYYFGLAQNRSEHFVYEFLG